PQGTQQAHDARLHQLRMLDARRVSVYPRERADRRHERLNEILAGAHIAAGCGDREPALGRARERRPLLQLVTGRAVPAPWGVARPGMSDRRLHVILL